MTGPARIATLLAFVWGLSETASALTIVPTFDSTILDSAQSQEIQSCIKSAVAVYGQLFTDNITVSILFRYSDTTVQGTSFVLGASHPALYTTNYAAFLTSLNADQITPNDIKALSNLSEDPLNTILFTSANARALGRNDRGTLDASGGSTGSFDGIIVLNSSQPMQFDRTGGIAAGNYDARMVIEHEIDEVLGLGSVLDQPVTNQVKPEDFFRYSIDSGTAALTLDASSTATSYFSIDGGASNLAAFNQSPTGDRGDWLSPSCGSHTLPLVQYAFICAGTTADISATSPEGIALDVIGYDLAVPPAGPPAVLTSGVVPVYSKATTIEPGSWGSIFGSNLASVRASWKGDFPTELGGTTVTINNKPAYLWFVSPGQINFQAPDDTVAGPVDVVVTTAAGSFTSTVNLGATSPSFSLLDSIHVAGVIPRIDGSGAYATGTVNSYDLIGPTGTSLGYQTVAAKAGETVVLYGVGFGPTNPTPPAGQLFLGPAPTQNPVSMRIGDVSVTPAFAGLIEAGLYQFNLTIPAGAGSGDVTLTASVAGTSSQTAVVISLQ